MAETANILRILSRCDNLRYLELISADLKGLFDRFALRPAYRLRSLVLFNMKNQLDDFDMVWLLGNSAQTLISLDIRMGNKPKSDCIPPATFDMIGQHAQNLEDVAIDFDPTYYGDEGRSAVLRLASHPNLIRLSIMLDNSRWRWSCETWDLLKGRWRRAMDDMDLEDRKKLTVTFVDDNSLWNNFPYDYEEFC